MLLPATNLISSVPLPAPPVVFLSIISLLLSTNDNVVVFCVFVSVEVIAVSYTHLTLPTKRIV